MHTNERFPTIEIPKRYWSIWSNILKSIRSSQQILINNIGKCIRIADSPWIITRDRIHLYHKQTKFYVGYKLEKIDKNVYHYSNTPLFRTSFESVEHLLPVTVYTHHSTWAVKQPKDKTSKTIHSKHLLHDRNKFNPSSALSKCLYSKKKTQMTKLPETTVRLNKPSSIGRLGEYNPHKYEEYREWWANNRINFFSKTESTNSKAKF